MNECKGSISCILPILYIKRMSKLDLKAQIYDTQIIFKSYKTLQKKEI